MERRRQSASRRAAQRIRMMQPARRALRRGGDKRVADFVRGVPLMLFGQHEPANFQGVRVVPCCRAQLIQLGERLGGVAQFQPAQGGAQVMSVGRCQFHGRKRIERTKAGQA